MPNKGYLHLKNLKYIKLPTFGTGQLVTLVVGIAAFEGVTLERKNPDETHSKLFH